MEFLGKSPVGHMLGITNFLGFMIQKHKQTL